MHGVILPACLQIQMNILTSEHWTNICQNVTNIALPILKINFNTRLRSEIISSLFEIESQKYYESIGLKVKSASNDHDPDLFFEAEQKSTLFTLCVISSILPSSRVI